MGTLDGFRVVEFAALGPASYACMLLADMGAEVIRIERPTGDPAFQRDIRYEHLLRGRRSIVLDLRNQRARAIALDLLATADVLVEGGRPGSMERLGLGPDECHAVNPGLVYGRLSGWGQQGPRAATAGHDINYISLTGALSAIGERGRRPLPPLGLVGDFGGGAMFLALGICAALLERERSGLGDVIDAAMVDGASSLMTPVFGWHASGEWVGERGSNRVDGGAPFYRTYECADGRYVAVGAIEEKFFDLVLAELGVDSPSGPARFDREDWPRLSADMERAFLVRSRDEWAELFQDSDACVTPVLELDEVQVDAHMQARGAFAEGAGGPVPAPAPRFARSASAMATPQSAPGRDTSAILAELGLSEAECAALSQAGAVRGRIP